MPLDFLLCIRAARTMVSTRESMLLKDKLKVSLKTIFAIIVIIIVVALKMCFILINSPNLAPRRTET